MSLSHTTTALLLIVSAGWIPACGQNATQSASADPPTSATRPHISFSFERKGLPIPKYQLTIVDNATGLYEGEEALRQGGADTSAELPPQKFSRPMNISPATVARIFKLSEQLNRFNKTCASKLKNIADQGTKILTYTGPDGTGSCTYNYTEIKDLQALTDIFEGIAETMDEGRMLDHLHRYDRLGLDAAMKFFADEVSSGHAIEVGTIAASLHSIASDPDVMERVRTRANTLLALTSADAALR